MKAVLMRALGAADVLRLEEVETPKPGPGEVLVEVRAVSVNRTLDIAVRAGRYVRQPPLPHVLGADPSGVIVEVGRGVNYRRAGERVATQPVLKQRNAPPRLLGVDVWGGYAQYVKLPARNTFLVPDGLDFAMATAVARHGPLAMHLLRERARVKRGDWVLVMGAAGGLGNAGVQAAKLLGANVIAGAGAPSRVQTGLALGADAGVDYRQQDLIAAVQEITGGRGVDVVFENIGDPDLFPKALMCMAEGGRLVTAGGHGGGLVPLNVNRLYQRQLTIMGSVGFTPADVDFVLQQAGQGRFRLIIDRTMPLEQAARAHELVERRAASGKVVLDPTMTTAS